MREDRSYGHDSPQGRKDLILAATNLYCSICDARPCYLLSTAAMTVAQEQLTESDGDNLIGAVRYMQSLEKLHHCLTRHTEVSKEAWQLDNHFRVSEQVLNELERQGYDTKQLKANLHVEARNGDPPSLISLN
jgi:hypothetical protein